MPLILFFLALRLIPVSTILPCKFKGLVSSLTELQRAYAVAGLDRSMTGGTDPHR
jgi:hypothetical protein